MLVFALGCATPSPKPVVPSQLIDVKTTTAKPLSHPSVERDAAKILASAFTSPAITPKPSAEVQQTGDAAWTLQSSQRPLNVLALSGGGQYSAFAAGVVAGWTATGKRPDFDVVTGISSGALLASIVFLGPKWDPLMAKVFTTLKTSDLFKYRPVLYLIRYQSLASAEPMRQLIANEVNDEFIADMCTAHRAGRRLYVGTMNQHTRRLVVWDLGAIACSGHPEAGNLVRKILLAAASIPGLLPAVDFDFEIDGVRYQETHVDGGAVAQAFIRFSPHMPCPELKNPSFKWLAGSNLYVIAGGKLYVDPLDEKPGFLTRVTGTVSATLYALYRADLWRLYSYCSVSGMNFHHTSIPLGVPTTPKSTTFDPVRMKELFTLGYDLTTRGEVWRTTPPGCENGEDETPRP